VAAEPREETSVDDVELAVRAVRAVRLHCPVMQYPATTRCLNCGWPHPCAVYLWGRNILLAAGWSEREIAALDARTGPWS
jgi:hypothetical protein